VHIDCDSCLARETAACKDCIVTFLLDRPEGAIVIDVEQERALRTLAERASALAERGRSEWSADGATEEAKQRRRTIHEGSRRERKTHN
jgi:hypothetical protein